MPPRAYHGGRGWAYAKLMARKQPLLAPAPLSERGAARLLSRRAWRVIVFLQIFLGAPQYRRLADHRHRLAAYRPARADEDKRRCASWNGRDHAAAHCWRPARLRWRFPPQRRTRASLRDLAAARGLVFGSAAASYELKDADFAAAAAARCRPAGARI